MNSTRALGLVLRRLPNAAAAVFLGLVPLGGVAAQQTVNFPTADGGVVFADRHGQGAHAVVLAPGGRFTKEGWAPQAAELAAAGFQVQP